LEKVKNHPKNKKGVMIGEGGIYEERVRTDLTTTKKTFAYLPYAELSFYLFIFPDV